MSGIYGALDLAGSPVSADLLQDMHAVFANWFNDDRGVWFRGNVGVGHTMLWNTPESKYEDLPKAVGNQGETLVITADVRLDNRTELAEQLGLGARLDRITDSHLVLEAYRKWGKQSTSFLLGDFVYAIWDESNQHIFCARDHLGVRPFYYAQIGSCFYFANDMEPLAKCAGISSELSTEALASYCTYGQLRHPTATFYADIQKLPPGNTLTIDVRGITTEKYWHPERVPVAKQDDSAVYVLRLQELLTTAIESRSRSAFPVGAHLSGGLDSSVIAVCASRYLKRQDKSLSVYNWIRSPDTSEDSSEVDFEISRRLATTEGMEHHYVDFEVTQLSEKFLEHNIAYNDTALLRYEPFVRDMASASGVRTLLSGWGGDEFASYAGSNHIASLFWRGRWISSLRENFRANSDIAKLGWLKRLRRSLGRVIVPVLPYRLYAMIRGFDQDESDFSEVLNPLWQRRVRDTTIKIPNFSRLSSRKRQLQLLSYGHLATRLESWAAGGMRSGMDYRYPLLDKRIVEFILSVPDEYFCIGTQPRGLFRTAAASWLSQSDRLRKDTKREPNRMSHIVSMEKALVNYWQEQLDMTFFADNMLVDGRVIRQLLNDLCGLDPKQEPEEFNDKVAALFCGIFGAKLQECKHEKA